MTRLAKYLYWTKENYGYKVTRIPSYLTGLSVAIDLGIVEPEHYKPLMSIHNSKDWRNNYWDIFPINILTGKIHKKYLDRCILTNEELNQIKQFIQKHKEFLLKVTKDCNISSCEICDYFEANK